MASRLVVRPVVAVPLLLSTAVVAQDAPAPQLPLPTPTATPTPAPIPTLTVNPSFDQDSAPIVEPTPRPTSRPTSRAPRPQPAPSATPSPKPSATPIPAATPAPSPTPSPAPTPAPSPTRAPRLPIETVILPPPRAATPLWPWLVGGGALLMVVLGGIALRRQPHEAADAEPELEPLADPLHPPPPPPPPSSPRGRLAITLRPVRVGLNLISVTAECEVTIANTGGASVEDVRAALRLLSAHDGQEAELAAFYAQPISRVPTPSFTLEPGEAHSFRIVTALPHDSIHALDLGGRPLFAALLALAVRYYDGHGPRWAGQAFVLGGERGDAARLAPFWLDGRARTYDNVACRPLGEPVEG